MDVDVAYPRFLEHLVVPPAHTRKEIHVSIAATSEEERIIPLHDREPKIWAIWDPGFGTARVYASHHANYLPRLHECVDFQAVHNEAPRFWYSRPYRPPLINQRTAYLAFTPVFMPTSGLLGVLNYKQATMPIEVVNGRWQMVSKVLRQWEALVPSLSHATVALINSSVRYDRGVFFAGLHTPLSPEVQLKRLRTRGWPLTPEGQEDARRHVGFAWKSFFALFALLSYAIAVLPDDDVAFPPWVKILQDANVDEFLINDLRVEVADFSGRRPRIGALLNILQERHNYTVFVRCCVPAWFNLDELTWHLLQRPGHGGFKVPSMAKMEEARLSPSYPLRAPDLPPPAPPITWAVRTVRTERGSLINAAVRTDSGSYSSHIPTRQGYQEDLVTDTQSRRSRGAHVPEDYPEHPPHNRQRPLETPEEFFMRMEEERQDLIASETPDQKQSRLSLESYWLNKNQQVKTPGASARLQLWEWRPEGSRGQYWIRHPVPLSEADDYFGEYPFEQRHINVIGYAGKGGKRHPTIDFWRDPDGPTYAAPDDLDPSVDFPLIGPAGDDLDPFVEMAHEEQEIDVDELTDDPEPLEMPTHPPALDLFLMYDPEKHYPGLDGRKDAEGKDEEEDTLEDLLEADPHAEVSTTAKFRIGIERRDLPFSLSADRDMLVASNVFGVLKACNALPNTDLHQDIVKFVKDVIDFPLDESVDSLGYTQIERWHLADLIVNARCAPVRWRDLPNGEFYWIYFYDDASKACPWRLVVYDALTALHCLRLSLDDQYMKHETLRPPEAMAVNLLGCGIRFSTRRVAWDADIRAPHPPPRRGLGFCSAGWRVTDDNYRACYGRYLEARNAVLVGDTFKAALKSGCLIFRLAVDAMRDDYTDRETAYEDCMEGPSPPAAYPKSRGQWFYPPTGGLWYDDALSDHELDVICGVYHVYINPSEEMKAPLEAEAGHLSWWPTPTIWAAERGHGDIWTPDDEVWFLQHKRMIKDHKFKPLLAHEWRKKIRIDRKGKKFWNRIRATSKAYLNERGSEWITMIDDRVE